MSTERIWTAALAVIGDEILSGRTQDKNVSQIALWLNLQGIRLREVRIVPDIEDEIVDCVNALLVGECESLERVLGAIGAGAAVAED